MAEEIATGVVPEPAVVEYEFKGAMKYASYYVTERGHCILVVSADKDDLMSTVHRVTLTGTSLHGYYGDYRQHYRIFLCK